MYLAVEMSGAGYDSSGMKADAHINDTGFYRATPEKAWELVKHVFSKEHTIIIDEDGRVCPIK